jgi:hypothetical protein
MTRSRITSALNDLQKQVKTKTTIGEALEICNQWTADLMAVCKKEEIDGYRNGVKNTRK